MTGSLPLPVDGALVRVLIVDNDRRVRRSLADLIDLADGVTCCGVAEDLAGAVACLQLEHADVCLIDPRVPDDPHGVALMAELRSHQPDLLIVAMSSADASEPECMDNGADAFVAKSGQPEALVETVITVAARRGPSIDREVPSGEPTGRTDH